MFGRGSSSSRPRAQEASPHRVLTRPRVTVPHDLGRTVGATERNVPQLAASWGPRSPRTWGGGSPSTSGKSGAPCLSPLPPQQHLNPNLLLFTLTPLSWGPVLKPRPGHDPGLSASVAAPHPLPCAPGESEGLGCHAPRWAHRPASWGSGFLLTMVWGADPHSGPWPGTLRIC